jgi:hypothetical protein
MYIALCNAYDETHCNPVKSSMQNIPMGQLETWAGSSSPPLYYPTTLNVQCAACKSISIIFIKGAFADGYSWIGTGRCSKQSCKEIIRLVCFYSDDPQDKRPYAAYVDPSQPRDKEPIENHDLIDDPRVKLAYISVLDTYNKDALMAIPSMVGRALEGIVKHQLKESKEVDLVKVRMLGPLLDLLAEKVDLSLPLKDLAKALTDARNVGTHFDIDIEPTKDMAVKMLELLEVIIEYIYVLPAQVINFRRYITEDKGDSLNE